MPSTGMNVGRLSISEVDILPAYDTVVKVDKRFSIIVHGTHLPDMNNVTSCSEPYESLPSKTSRVEGTMWNQDRSF